MPESTPRASETARDVPARVACSRMYDATPAVRGLWHELFAWVGRRASIELVTIDHAAPLPLDLLWDRQDLGVAFMCGFPFVTRTDPVTLLCAPVPKGEGFDGTPRYRSLFVTSAESPLRQLSDSFGGTIAWNVTHSYSGYQAPRHHLSKRSRNGEALFRASIGPLGTPRATLEAVLDGRADVCTVDSYLFALLLCHEPDFAARFRVLDQTELVPIPPLIAARNMPSYLVSSLKQALLAAREDREIRTILDALSLLGFSPIERQGYDELLRRSHQADGRAYRALI